MSTKTLLSAAANALPVRFTFGVDWTVTGFLCGMDSYHWKVVEDKDGTVEVHLIHKTHAMVTVLEGETPWTDLPDEQRVRIEHIVAPFHKSVLSDRQQTNGATKP